MTGVGLSDTEFPGRRRPREPEGEHALPVDESNLLVSFTLHELQLLYHTDSIPDSFGVYTHL